MDEHDYLFVLITREEDDSVVLNNARSLGWTEKDCGSLSRYIEANRLLAMGEVYQGKAILDSLRQCGNYYVQYYATIFFNSADMYLASLNQVGKLSQNATDLLIQLHELLSSGQDSYSIHAVSWIKAAVRLALVLRYIRGELLDWFMLREPVVEALRSIEHWPNEAVNSLELHWLLCQLNRNADPELGQIINRIASKNSMDLNRSPFLFP